MTTTNHKTLLDLTFFHSHIAFKLKTQINLKEIF